MPSWAARAIPVNLAKAIAEQLIDEGEVTRGFLGVVIQQLTPELADSFDLERNKGILVAQVSDDSPASGAGLRPGDVIVEYRGEAVTDVGSFRNRVALTAPGSKQQLTVIRDGERKNLNVTIGRLTDEKLVAKGTAHTTEKLGLTVQTLTPKLAEAFAARAGEGVVVTEVKPGSIASLAGIDVGTVVLKVNRMSVNSAAEFQRAIQNNGDRRVLFLIRKDGMQRFVALNW